MLKLFWGKPVPAAAVPECSDSKQDQKWASDKGQFKIGDDRLRLNWHYSHNSGPDIWSIWSGILPLACTSPSCVQRRNSIWSTHPPPADLPATCEIPDVVGVWWWYKRSLSCMGTIYSLMCSSPWLPACLAWDFFVCCFCHIQEKIDFLIDAYWDHLNSPHPHLLLPSTEREQKHISRFPEPITS